MLCEKFLAHTYTVITIYVLPAPWKYWIPLLMGSLGVWLVIWGLGKDEVRGSLLGYSGAVLIWMSWFESGLPVIARFNGWEPVLPETGNMMAGLMGEHILLSQWAVLPGDTAVYAAKQRRSLQNVAVAASEITIECR